MPIISPATLTRIGAIMKKLLILMLMVTNLTATNLPVEEQELEPDLSFEATWAQEDWTQDSGTWRDVEDECDHYFLMQEDIQKELERVTTALMVYDALLAIVPCVVQDARRIEENLNRQNESKE